MGWIEGRAGTGYYKFPLLKSNLLKADCWLLKYPEGSYIPEHLDPVDSGKHYRLNVVLKGAIGGTFCCKNTILNWWNGRVVLFRPDIEKHQVTPITKGQRLVLSIGWRR